MRGNVILKFLYLKTRTAIVHANDPLKGLRKACGDRLRVLNLKKGNDLSAWRDGLALALPTHETPSQLAARIDGPLMRFEEWAIHDGREVSNGPGGYGLATAYFQKIAAAQENTKLRTQQLFLRFSANEQERDEAIAEIRRIHDGCIFEPAMYLGNGRIFLIHTDATELDTQHCAQRYPKRLLDGWALSEASGYVFGTGAWMS